MFTLHFNKKHLAYASCNQIYIWVVILRIGKTKLKLYICKHILHFLIIFQAFEIMNIRSRKQHVNKKTIQMYVL